MATLLGYPTIEPIRAYLIGPDGKAVEFDAGSICTAVQLKPDDCDKTGWDAIRPVEITMSATLRPLPRRARVKLLQLAGILRAPRCTYRTNVALVNRRRYNGHRRPAK